MAEKLENWLGRNNLESDVVVDELLRTKKRREVETRENTIKVRSEEMKTEKKVRKINERKRAIKIKRKRERALEMFERANKLQNERKLKNHSFIWLVIYKNLTISVTLWRTLKMNSKKFKCFVFNT